MQQLQKLWNMSNNCKKNPKQLFLCDYYALTPQLICSQFFFLKKLTAFLQNIKVTQRETFEPKF